VKMWQIILWGVLGFGAIYALLIFVLSLDF
jgi:hypothetical protein